MTPKEKREQIKVAKANHKEALKNKAKYISKRNELVYAIMQSRALNWGGVSINLINW